MMNYDENMMTKWKMNETFENIIPYFVGYKYMFR